MVVIGISKPVWMLLSGERHVQNNTPCISSLYSQLSSYIYTDTPSPITTQKAALCPHNPLPPSLSLAAPPPPSVRSRCWARPSAEVKWQHGAQRLPREKQGNHRHPTPPPPHAKKNYGEISIKLCTTHLECFHLTGNSLKEVNVDRYPISKYNILNCQQ